MAIEDRKERQPSRRVSQRVALGALAATAGVSAFAGAVLAQQVTGQGDGEQDAFGGLSPEGSSHTQVLGESKTELTVIPGTNIPIPATRTVTPTQTETETSTITPPVSTVESSPRASMPPADSSESEILEVGATVFDKLEKSLRDQEVDEQLKSDLLAKVDKYRTIEQVQNGLILALLASVGPDGTTPELLYYMGLNLPSHLGVDASSQLFIKRNKQIWDLRIAPDLNTLASSNFTAADLEQFFNTHNRYLIGSNEYDSVPYVGISIDLAEYVNFLGDKSRASEVNTEGLSEADKAFVKTLQEKLGPFVGPMKITKGDLLSGFHFGPSEPGEASELKLAINNVIDLHEGSHAIDPTLNHSIIYNLSYEQVIKLLTLRYRVLADPVYGRKHADFANLLANVANFSDFEKSSFYAVGLVISNNDGARDGIVPGLEPNDVAKTNSGEVITKEFYESFLALGTFQEQNLHHNWTGFLKGEEAKLDSLSQLSPYYKWAIDYLRANQTQFDTLAKVAFIPKMPIDGKENPSAYYYEFLREGFDGIFMMEVFANNPQAVGVFNAQDQQTKTALLRWGLELLERADWEQWAYSMREHVLQGNVSPAHEEFLQRYRTIVASFID